ncbi:MAG: ferredoxin family protein [Acidobacteriota bacterium]|nr:ferredoxin family protein [Acidobacteriota bacterium]
MASANTDSWHGIPRQEIPWFPTVNAQACIGCELCYVTCGRGVYELKERKAFAAQPYACMVGCSTCARVCPTEAIHFPDGDVVRRVEREHRILQIVREEAKAKRSRQEAQKARTSAEEALGRLTCRTRLEIAGAFGNKHFLRQLQDLIADYPVDLVNLELRVPTVRGLAEKVPAFMRFEVVSTEQADIQAFLPLLRDLARRNGFVLVNEVGL